MFNSNAGVDRKFKLTERFTAAFRTDIFNLGNTPHHSLGNSSVNSGTFMQALGIINTGLEGSNSGPSASRSRSVFSGAAQARTLAPV
jgi:hypothetical protein